MLGREAGAFTKHSELRLTFGTYAWPRLRYSVGLIRGLAGAVPMQLKDLGSMWVDWRSVKLHTGRESFGRSVPWMSWLCVEAGLKVVLGKKGRKAQD